MIYLIGFIEKNDIGRKKMSVCYDKLWKILIDKQMNRTELKDKAGKVLALQRKGAKSIFPDVLSIEQELLK